jgi:hypothetical protein
VLPPAEAYLRPDELGMHQMGADYAKNLPAIQVLTKHIKNVTQMYVPGDRDLFVIGMEDA